MDNDDLYTKTLMETSQLLSSLYEQTDELKAQLAQLHRRVYGLYTGLFGLMTTLTHSRDIGEAMTHCLVLTTRAMVTPFDGEENATKILDALTGGSYSTVKAAKDAGATEEQLKAIAKSMSTAGGKPGGDLH